uniref:Efflux transporter, outer membrane factor (OMF) lipoprotein, NodT family n=1 Tax=Candidatus Kentrum sp. TC TaxID=2126339 RepID=A0A450Z8G1_9GAMM|nr:MAG: efflux transporter, outer membrane factor (OMF) lipoprotein, NodT family [Candidatus Kentron sp. TC]
MRLSPTILAVLYSWTLVGCMNPIQFSEPRPEALLPEKWSAPGEMAAEGAAMKKTESEATTDADAGGDSPDDSIPSWIADFDDPKLHALVEEAVGKNFDLDLALARVKAARARARREGAGKLPDIDAAFSASRARNGSTGITVNNFDLGIDVSWEIDLWNRLDNAAKAAAVEAKAQELDYRMARLSLAANVANAWFGAIESGQQLRLAEKTIDSFENSLGAIEQRYRLGIGTALGVRLARENVATARSQREVRARDRDTAMRTLEILLGRYPSAALDIQRDLPGLRRGIPVGLPANLLERRPDIIAANARLLAADHRIAEARANRLPSISLTASGGTASGELRDLLRPDSLAWSLLGGLTQPLWDAGRLSANVEIARADRQRASAEYALATLRAFREVESALTAEVLLANQEAALNVAAQEAKAAVALAMEEYRQGLSDIVTLLSTQRRKFGARSSLLSAAKQRLITRVNLYLALGGGF